MEKYMETTIYYNNFDHCYMGLCRIHASLIGGSLMTLGDLKISQGSLLVAEGI